MAQRVNEPEVKEGGNVQYLTPSGFQALQAELDQLTLVKRPEIADRIRESQQHGEFSEDNSELDEVKFEQAMVEARIAELKALFANAQQLDPDRVPTDHVGLASVVKVKDVQFGDQFEIQVVAGIEADPNQDRICTESPMGVALMGKVVGDRVEFDSPSGRCVYEVLAIRK
jgi:transcription elongation factor GreA